MKKQMLLIAATVILTLASCGQSAVQPSSSTGGADESTLRQTQVETQKEPSARNPLTGLAIAPEKVNRRPVAVMLNNLEKSLPQLGVSQADVIYEVLAEGGITRMLAVFQDLDGVGDLGSIRSTRAYYLELALGHDAILVHAGGSPEAYSCIPKWGVSNLDGVNGGSEQEIFWRDADRKRNLGYEHSLLTSGDAILEYLSNGRYALDHEDGYHYEMLFAEDGTPQNGSAAQDVCVNFSKTNTGEFHYDPESGKYLVEDYGAPYLDGNTGEQVAVTNVIVLRTRISLISGDSAGRISVDLTSGGEGFYCNGGKAVPISWSKAGREGQLTYAQKDGTPLTLGRGTSYVCIVGQESPVTIE